MLFIAEDESLVSKSWHMHPNWRHTFRAHHVYSFLRFCGFAIVSGIQNALSQVLGPRLRNVLFSQLKLRSSEDLQILARHAWSFGTVKTMTRVPYGKPEAATMPPHRWCSLVLVDVVPNFLLVSLEAVRDIAIGANREVYRGAA